MSIFKRLRATVTAQVDDMVSQIENHDAVIESALGDAKGKVAKAKVRCAALKRDRDSLQRKVQHEQSQIESWTQRAIANQSDEGCALNCLQRRKQCQQRLEELQGMLRQVSEAERSMQKDIEQAEKNIHKMSQKREIMMARETAADSMQSLGKLESGLSSNLNRSFDRWEERIAVQALDMGVDRDIEPVDEFEQGFQSREEHEALAGELQALIAEQSSNTHNDRS